MQLKFPDVTIGYRLQCGVKVTCNQRNYIPHDLDRISYIKTWALVICSDSQDSTPESNAKTYRQDFEIPDSVLEAAGCAQHIAYQLIRPSKSRQVFSRAIALLLIRFT